MNLFNLAAKVTLNTKGYDAGVNEATSKGRKLASVLGSGLKSAAMVGVAGITAAAGGIAALTGGAIKNYAQFEQLVGGVDTLFKDSSQKVQEYADNAYKTAGMSANEYMDTVTSFSASLLQSLDGDTEKAAEVADQAIRDMSDNANKMGTDIGSIQYAYQGFAKQNFTMLDNLKLGYGGTQAEMQRLLEDAEKLSGVHYDLSSYADITEAIHVIQTEMGITGTTAAEAASTIEGSVNSMKAAWTNLKTGLADENANIDELLDQFLDSVDTVADNILPVIGRILSNISNKIIENFPQIVQRGAELLAKLAVGIVKAIPEMLKSIPKVIDAIIEGFKKADADWLDIGRNVVMGIFDGIGSMVAWANEKIFGFVGGIVSKVKEKLGIHSPSRVFAEIGGYMAEGMGEGWSMEYGTVKDRIAKDMDFGTAKIGFAESGIGISSAQMINSVSKTTESNAPMTFNLVLPDGTKLASYMLNPLASYAKANGTPILNPI